MASEGSDESRAVAVANVASRLFGAEIGPDAVIDESLQRATDDALKAEHVVGALSKILTQSLPDTLDDEALKHHPLSVWVELELGLDDGLELRRKSRSHSNKLSKSCRRPLGSRPKSAATTSKSS